MNFFSKKKCCKCGFEKDINAFNKNITRKDGLENRCRECAHEDGKKWRKNNLMIQLENNKRWQTRNPKSFAASKQIWRRRNLEQCTDTYIRECLSRGSILSTKDIPLELIEVKRVEILIKRLVKEKEHEEYI